MSEGGAAKPPIRHETMGRKGRYVMEVGGVEAEMTYSRLSDTLIIVDHTGVPETLAGNGYGSALARFAVDAAQAGGWRIVPLCPFLNGWRARHPEHADVFQV